MTIRHYSVQEKGPRQAQGNNFLSLRLRHRGNQVVWLL
jgi:hypothetical protein